MKRVRRALPALARVFTNLNYRLPLDVITLDGRRGHVDAGGASVHKGARMTTAARVGIVAVFCWCAAVQAEPENTRAASARRLSWLAGCWAYIGAEAGSGETWMPPAGGTLFSTARRVQGGRVVSYEFQRIADDESGLAFYASPSGQPEVRFGLKSLTANEAVFENPANDFPQRVIYRLAQSGNISARIEGAKDAPARAVDFAMKRTSCEKARKR